MGKVIVKQLKDLKGNPANPRKISKEQLENLKRSLDEFGDLSGFVFNRRTNQLIGAHQRAAVSPKDAQVYIDKKFDEPTKTGTVAEGWIDINGERHKYREVDVDDQREKAMNIAANKHGGDFDMPKLTEWLLELDAHNVDLSVVGFTDAELEEIMAPVHGNEGLADADAVPEVPKEAKTKRGELWILGNHRVLCGDATDKADVERLMAGEKADMVLTDPPYLLETQGGCKGEVGKALKKQGASIEFIADFNPNEFLETLPLVFEKGKMNAYVFCNKDLLPDYLVWARKAGFSFNVLVWKKPNAIPIGDSHRPDIEYLLLFRKSAIWNNGIDGVNYSRLIECGREKGLHPTMKPVEILENELKISSNKNSIVGDFFLGSGSTLIACEKTGRRCYGTELEPIYIDVILDRWAKFTGQDPVREDGVKWSELRQPA